MADVSQFMEVLCTNFVSENNTLVDLTWRSAVDKSLALKVGASGLPGSIPRIIKTDLEILTVGRRLARPGHLWVCGRKNESCSSTRRLVPRSVLGLI